MFSPARSETSRHHGETVAAVLLHIEEHLEEPLTLEELASVAGFSRHHFHRVFHCITGEAPKEYVRRLRLERAVYRMKVSPDNVLQIALDAGFATHETFTRAFVRHFEISPSEFRAVLKEYRAVVHELHGAQTFQGFTDETPLTLRFDMQRTQIAIERTPGRHLLCIRHHGYEGLLDPGQPLVSLWGELFAYAEKHGIEYRRDCLVAITHDDPYVVDEDRIRFDACIEVAERSTATFPIAYRWLPPRLCVSRRHDGGLGEVAKTFAHIGVDWLTDDGYGLATAPPFTVYTCRPAPDGDPQVQYADSYVPLDTLEGAT